MTLTVLTRPCTCAREEVGRGVVSGDSGLHNPLPGWALRFTSHNDLTQLSENRGLWIRHQHPKGCGQNQAKGMPEMAQAKLASEDPVPSSRLLSFSSLQWGCGFLPSLALQVLRGTKI